MLGEAVYRPSERDLVTTGAAPRRFFISLTTTASLTVVSISSSPVPTDEVWIVQHIAIVITPGSGQTTSLGLISVQQTQTLITVGIATTVQLGSGAGATTGFSLPTEFAMLPGEFLTWTATFSALTQPNGFSAYAIGFAIPRGNVIR